MMVARRTEEGLLLRVSLERKRNRPSSFSLCRRSRRRSTSPLFLIRCRVVMREKRYDQGLNYSWDSLTLILTDVFFLTWPDFGKSEGMFLLVLLPVNFPIQMCFHWSEIQSTLFRISQNALLWIHYQMFFF